MADVWTAKQIEELLAKRPIAARVRVSTSQRLAQIDIYHAAANTCAVGDHLLTAGWVLAGSHLAMPDGVVGYFYTHTYISTMTLKKARGIILRFMVPTKIKPTNPVVSSYQRTVTPTAKHGPDIERLFNAGSSYDEIARKLKVSRGVVAGRLKRRGLRRKKVESIFTPAYLEDCYWPADRIKKAVSDCFGEDSFETSDMTHRAGLYLAGCILVGADVTNVSIGTGLNKGECHRFDARARRAEIVAEQKVHDAPWEKKDEGMINFVLDCLVVSGKIKCKGPRGDQMYYAAQ